MPVIKSQVVFGSTSGLPRDQVVNTFHWFCETYDVTKQGLIAGFLESFYESVPGGGTKSLNGFFGPSIVLPYSIRLYNLADPEPRVPIIIPKALGSTGSGSLPRDVALVGSFQGDPQAGVSPRRKRGRIYFGPVSAYYGGTTSESTGTNLQSWFGPSAAFIETLRLAMLQLSSEAAAAADLDWIVYSAAARDNSDDTIPYEERPLLAPMNSPVSNGWVDNEWDTQRGRGTLASTRSVWPS